MCACTRSRNHNLLRDFVLCVDFAITTKVVNIDVLLWKIVKFLEDTGNEILPLMFSNVQISVCDVRFNLLG